jgi:hypothetical protein
MKKCHKEEVWEKRRKRKKKKKFGNGKYSVVLRSEF